MKQYLLILALSVTFLLQPHSETSSQQASPLPASSNRCTARWYALLRAQLPVYSSQVTLAGDGANSRTFDMKDVKSIEYGTPSAPVFLRQPAHWRRRPNAAPPPRWLMSAPLRKPPQGPIFNCRLGTEVAGETNEVIDSKRAAEGQSYSADVSSDILDSSGSVVIPRGSNADVVIRSSTKGGRISVLLTCCLICDPSRSTAGNTLSIRRTLKRAARTVLGRITHGRVCRRRRDCRHHHWRDRRPRKGRGYRSSVRSRRRRRHPGDYPRQHD